MDFEELIKAIFFVVLVLGAIAQKIFSTMRGNKSAENEAPPAELAEEVQRRLRELIEQATGQRGSDSDRYEAPPPVRPLPGKAVPPPIVNAPPARPMPLPSTTPRTVAAPRPATPQATPRPAPTQRPMKAQQATPAPPPLRPAPPSQPQPQPARAPAPHPPAPAVPASEAYAQTARRAPVRAGKRNAAIRGARLSKAAPEASGTAAGVSAAPARLTRGRKLQLNSRNLGTAVALSEIMQAPRALRREHPLWE